MTKKTTRRALVASVISLVLCFTMLIGTTFAWFTDSVKSGKNKIVAGNLDVELEYAKFDNGKFDRWESVEGAEDIFDPNALWEPGHTEVAYLKVSNLGTLALKYQLNVNVYSEVAGTNVDGKIFYLSDYLVFKVVDIAEAEVGTYTRDTAIAAAGTEMGLKAYNGETTSLDAKDGANDEDYVALIIYMPTTVGNEANYKTGTKAPSIEMGVELYATQLAAENDSFGNDYDKNAAYSVWDGTVPAEMPETLVVDGATQTVHVKDAAAFAYLSTLSAKWAEFYTDGNGTTYTNYANGAGANYYYSSKWTVSLETDIDLNNKALAPVNIVLGQSTGASAFDGNYHTIRNINTTTGLFADKARATFSNLTLENVKATNGALIGSADHNISNVTVKNATISGVDYVGGIVGYSYGAVNGCKVIDSSVVATGKEAGGLAGYVVTSGSEATVAHNTVKNVTVYAGNRAAGLIAQVNVNVKVRNNTVDTVTVGAADTSAYQPGTVVSNALAPANVFDNTIKNVTISTKAATADDNAALGTAIADGADTVFLSSGNYVIPSAAQGKTGLTFVGTGDTTVAVTKVGTGGENCDYGLDGSTVTFENITITTNSSTYIGYARCNATYNNCTFNGTYTLYGDSVFNNCTFNVTGDVYNIWTWGAPTATFNNCTFNSDGKALLLYGTANTKLTVNGCTFNDNGGLTDLKAAIEIGNDYGKSYELIVNNTTVNGYEINDKGINTGTTLWANKNSMGTDKLNVVVDGVDVY